jgi:hypothetical protein
MLKAMRALVYTRSKAGYCQQRRAFVTVFQVFKEWKR